MLQLKRLREQTDMSQKEIAERINKTPQAYNFYELGKREPDLETIVKLADIFMVSVDTILNHTPLTQPGHSMSVTPDERRLLKYYRELSADSRKTLFNFIKFLKTDQEEDAKEKEKEKERQVI